MTENYIVNVQSSRMLSIFAGVDIEQPYRFQPQVRFVIQLEEYIKFVRETISLSLNWLSFDVAWYKKALTKGNERFLLNLFYFDVSKAIINELMLAVANGEDGTVICHAFTEHDVTEMSIEDVTKELLKHSKEEISKAVNSIKSEVAGYFDTSTFSEHNLLLFRYALYLRTMCFSKELIKFNIL